MDPTRLAATEARDPAGRRLVAPRRPAHLRAVAIGIATALAVTLFPAPALRQNAAADTSSDIPGIPLAPGVVVGQLGGDIYDVVYSLDVAPGSVILASLAGSGATDFDLYLFDATATTVVTNKGVVARSTGPTSTESISYATAIGGRYYIDLNSATPAIGTYTLAVQVVADRAPVATLVLDGGRERTSQTNVSVSLTASGSLSGPARMAFSADGTTWGAWMPYQAVTSWTFPVGDGTKTLWAKVENSAGIASAPASASILLDTERPSVTAVDPAVTASLVGPRPTITVTFSEPIDPASWELLGLVVQTPEGALVPGMYGVAPDGLAGWYRPSVDLVVGATYVLTVASVRDVAGNLVAPIGSWVAVDLPAPEIVVTASARVVNRGAAVTLAGRLTAPSGVASLSLEATPVGALEVVSIGAVPVAADGTFSVRVTPSSTTVYAVRVPAAGGYGAGGATATVAVRRGIRITGAAASTVRAARVGSRITVAAAITPVTAGVTTSFRLERWNVATRTWRLVGTLTRRTGAAGTASVSWTPKGSGLYRWRAIAATTPDFSTAASAWVRWKVAP